MDEQSPGISIAVEWDAALQVPGNQVTGRVTLTQGRVTHCAVVQGEGSVAGDRFTFTAGESTRLSLTIAGAQLGPGANATLVTLENNYRSFSFFLRDVQRACPIYVPDCGAAVTSEDDPRAYAEIARELDQSGLRTRLQKIEAEPEESFEMAAHAVRRQPNCPTWLGLGRDMRTFLVNFRQDGEVWDWIQPQFHSTPVSLPEYEDKPVRADQKPVRYNFFFGRGVGCTQPLRRWLEDGVLPVLHAELTDGDITYQATAFASLERRPMLDPDSGQANLRGTHYLVADHYGFGNMQTESQAQERERLRQQEIERDEETVLYLRVEAQNIAGVPRYAWLKTPAPNAFHVGTTQLVKYQYMDGKAFYQDGDLVDRVFLTAKLNGLPMPQEEMALLLQPGEKANFDIFLPHRPLTPDRAGALAAQEFSARCQEVQAFWKEKLASAARVALPEKRISEMFTAGLLHLDLVTYGLEPDGVTAPCIGVYCPIGSESSPIVQFFDCMGWTNLAQRSLEYFLAKQHEDGFMQNFGGYMLETGAALWSMGEHYRYSRDQDWVRRIEPNLLKACEYLERWSKRNQRPELRGRGYGLLDGKVGDPEDPYHIFMLNGYAYLGLSRCAEMLEQVDPLQSERLQAAAEKLKGLVRSALAESAVRSPVVPLGDGRWVPALPPWAEYHGPVSLFADGGNWYTHGAFVARDSLIGPLYLAFQEVLGVDELPAQWLLEMHAELMTERNAAFSQPYYAPHARVHLQRGEVKPFLKTYYNTLAALADRETYTFWEHFQLISPHKTHEEGWFLMQTRWMLYLESGSDLHLLPGIPRKWLEDGRKIAIDGMASYFGRLKMSVESHLSKGIIRAAIEIAGDGRGLERVFLRLPHPEGKRALRCRAEAGCTASLEAENERVVIEPWMGKATLTVEYA